MKSTGAILCVLMTSLVALAGGAEKVVPGDLAFTNVNVIPMDRERVLANQTVVIKDKRIAAIGPASDIKPASGVQVVNGSGMYLMPGLMDLHGHLPTPQQAKDSDNLLFDYVANGVTTVLSMDGELGQFELRKKINDGTVIGPQLYLSSPRMGLARNIKSVEQADQLVREYKKAGYDIVKVHEDLTPEMYDKIAATTKEMKIPFGGHVADSVGLLHALQMGQIHIAHLDNYVEALVKNDTRPAERRALRWVGMIVDQADESKIPEVVRATVKSGAWVMPTMALWETWFFNDGPENLADWPEMKYVPKQMLNGWMATVNERLSATTPEANAKVRAVRRKILKALYDAGAHLALSTDAPATMSVPGFSLHREMKLFREVGLTPYQVLEIGTRKSAEHFKALGIDPKAPDNYGTVAVGKRADLLLLTANPLTDIANAAKRGGVMVNGRWIPEADIQRRLSEMAAGYGN